MSLPPGWAVYTTDEGKEYFHHAGRGVTQWDRPAPELPAADVYTPDLKTLDLSGAAPAARAASLDDVSLSPAATLPAPSGNMGGSMASSVSETAALRDETTSASRVSRLCALINVETLQEYFDVSSVEVKERIRAAALPFKVDSEPFRISPDFWGPFWVATTVILFIFGGSNFGKVLELGSDQAKTDYSLAGYVSSIVYGQLVGVPIVVRLAQWGLAANVEMNYKQLICAYGYSLFVFIPAAILCLIPIAVVKTLILFLALVWSLAFLYSTVLQDLDPTHVRFRMVVGAVLVGAQVVLCGFCRFSFFAGVSTPPPAETR